MNESTLEIPYEEFDRLKGKGQFERVYQLRASAANDRLVVYAGRNGQARSRVGLSVGRNGVCATMNWSVLVNTAAFELLRFSANTDTFQASFAKPKDAS